MLWSTGRWDVAVGSLCVGLQRGSEVSGAKLLFLLRVVELRGLLVSH
jgi:hypothetical protein